MKTLEAVILCARVYGHGVKVDDDDGNNNNVLINVAISGDRKLMMEAENILQ